MISAERKSLTLFLLLYAGSLVLFLGIIGIGYYNFHSTQIIKAQQNELRIMAFGVGRALKRGETPSEEVEWALTDQNGNPINGEFDLPNSCIDAIGSMANHEQYIRDDDFIYLIHRLSPRSDAAFFIVRTQLNAELFDRLLLNIASIWGGAFLFFMVIAGFLTKLFLKPLRDTINLLNRFIKDATHEMTTPISAILMSAEGFDRTVLSAKDDKRLSRIEIAARTLQAVYDDLAFVLLDAKTKRAAAQIELDELIAQRVEFFEPLGRARQVVWRVAVGAHKPPFADLREFTRILDNLLSNAIKYNKSGGMIGISVSECTLTVSDEGIGIALADREKIFERFTRLESAGGGFGLGLSIVKELCVRNQITISVNDHPSGGTEFTLRWG